MLGGGGELVLAKTKSIWAQRVVLTGLFVRPLSYTSDI